MMIGKYEKNVAGCHSISSLGWTARTPIRWAMMIGGVALSAGVSLGEAEEKQSFVVMTFNTGTTLRLPHDEGPADGYTSAEAEISDQWYGNGLSWPAAMVAARRMIQQVDPDIVAFQEIFDCEQCAAVPPEHRERFACEDWAPGQPRVPRRILGPEYQIGYHPGKRNKCLAVHSRFGRLQLADDQDHLEGYPIEGCGSGARVARATVVRPDGSRLTVISLHGTSGMKPQDQACRVRQVEQIFVDFGDGQPGVREQRNLILGDFNTDPGRAGGVDISAKRWNDLVGPGKAFHFVSQVGPDAPRSYRGFADIDHVVSDTFRGSCRYVGVGEGSPPVWEGVYFDHVPVICTLSE